MRAGETVAVIGTGGVGSRWKMYLFTYSWVYLCVRFREALHVITIYVNVHVLVLVWSRSASVLQVMMIAVTMWLFYLHANEF
jgi:hypothetical protein